MQVIQYDYSENQIPDVPDDSVDLVFADPPYNLGVNYEDDPYNDKMPTGSYCAMMGSAARQMGRSLRPGGTLWWVCPHDQVDWVGSMLQAAVGPRLYLIVWHETFSQYNRHDLTQDYRFIFCHVKQEGHKIDRSQITFNPDAIREPSERMRMGDKRAAGPRIPGRVWKIRRLQGTSNKRVGWHPAQIAPELLDRILLGWTNPGDTALDGFAGSASLGIQCLEHDRVFIGVERSEGYCRKMRERLKIGQACTSKSS